LGLFPYDLAEFVSPWQGFQGGDDFFTGKREVADRKVTEIAGTSARGQAPVRRGSPDGWQTRAEREGAPNEDN
jgi:hypothetical protein